MVIVTMGPLESISTAYKTRFRTKMAAAVSKENSNNSENGEGGGEEPETAGTVPHDENNASAVDNDFWSSYDFNSLTTLELQPLEHAATRIQAFTRMFFAKRELWKGVAAAITMQCMYRIWKARKSILKLHPPIYEFKAISKEELLGELASGDSIKINCQPYFPISGEPVQTVDGHFYTLRTPMGTRAAMKRKKHARKRKVASVSDSVVQMKDSKVRGKASSVVRHVKDLQNMMTYSSPTLADACPSADAIMLIRDEIAVQPDTKPQGLQQQKEEHFAVLVPDKFQTAAKRKELGKFFSDLGECMQSNAQASKRNFTCTSNGVKFLECVYGKPQKKKARKNNEGDGSS